MINKGGIPKLTRTAIFVDYDNVFITLEKNYETHERKKIQEQALAVIKNKYSQDQVLFTRAYLDFSHISISAEGFTLFQKNLIDLIHVYSGTNASDINLIIDIVKSIHVEKIQADKFVIVSSDSDMFPIIKDLTMLGKEVELYYFDLNTNEDYRELIEAIKVKNDTIENLLEIPKFIEKSDVQFTDFDSLKKIAEQVNEIISNIFNEFLKRDGNGNVIRAGTCNKGNLKDHLLNNKVFCRKDIENGYGIDYMLENRILIDYRTPQGYNTLLLNGSYFSDKGIQIDLKVTQENYDFNLTRNNR